MCTGIRLVAEDGTVVHAWTLEFEVDIHSEVVLVPRAHERTGTTPDGGPGKQWTSRYASLGASGVGLPIIVDGLNEKGLAVGTFYFPGSVGYQPYSPELAASTVAPWELGSYLLERHATVDEVRADIGNVVVPSVVWPDWGFAPPMHYVVHDAVGQCIVIEHVDGRLRVHDNPIGVMSNAPTFDWHMTNLRNYVGFSFADAAPVELGGVTVEPMGLGSGMLGMPGDFTPPSRFVRATAFSHSVLPAPTGEQAVLQAFKVLNAFDIPRGASREAATDQRGNVLADYTLWTSANDLANRRFYFRTYENSRIRMVDLMAQPLDGDAILTWPMSGAEEIVDLTASTGA